MRDKNYIPGLSSPKGGKRGCLCIDRDVYDRKCCNGDLREQGIGPIQRQATYILTENRESILTEDYNNLTL